MHNSGFAPYEKLWYNTVQVLESDGRVQGTYRVQ